MSEERLRRIEELEAKATPGPWQRTSVLGPEDSCVMTGPGGFFESCSADDDELIAHLRNEARWLVGRIRRLEKVREASAEVIVAALLPRDATGRRPVPEEQFEALKQTLADCDEEAAKDG